MIKVDTRTAAQHRFLRYASTTFKTVVTLGCFVTLYFLFKYGY